MSKSIKFERIDQAGTETVDLEECEEVIVESAELKDHTEEFTRYYKTPDGRWIAQYVGQPFPGPGGGIENTGCYEVETRRMAYLLLASGQRLPRELEGFRDVPASPDFYKSWLEAEAKGVLAGPGSLKPRWDAVEKKLWVGDVLCREYRKGKGNQVTLIGAFHDAGWPMLMNNPFNDIYKLDYTIRDFNKELNPDSLIRFARKDRKAAWRIVARGR